MRLIKPSIEFQHMTPDPLQAIEQAGRVCYKSEDRITEESAPKFVKMLLERGHEAMIEQAIASYKFICDRGVTHEVVRHRLFSYAQESTRYCNYKGGVTFIIPPWLDFEEGEISLGNETTPYSPFRLNGKPLSNGIIQNKWLRVLRESEQVYIDLVDRHNWTPQQARSVLPNSLKTEIVITGNLREWRHFFKLRASKKAHPQMQEVANMALEDMQKRIPVIFDDLG